MCVVWCEDHILHESQCVEININIVLYSHFKSKSAARPASDDVSTEG